MLMNSVHSPDGGPSLRRDRVQIPESGARHPALLEDCLSLWTVKDLAAFIENLAVLLRFAQ